MRPPWLMLLTYHNMCVELATGIDMYVRHRGRHGVGKVTAKAEGAA